MPNLIELLTLESHKLMMATPPAVKHRLKQKINKVLREELSEAAMIKAMKEVQQDLDLRLKSHPDAKAAMIASLVAYCLLLRHELREMARLDHQLHTRRDLNSLLGHVNNAARFSSMVQPLLKGSYTVRMEALVEALRRTH
jgi:hypothetical protein